MTPERTDGERALRSWFQDGPTAMPDRVIDAVAARIAREPQRSRWSLRGRSFMTTPIKLAAGVAAVFAVAVVALQVLPGNGGIGGPPSAAPSAATPSPTASSPTQSAVPPSPSIQAAVLRPVRSLPDFTVNATLPEGWSTIDPWAIAGPADVGPPAGIVIPFLRADGLFGDPCRWDVAGTGDEDQPGDVQVGPTVDDLATALTERTTYDATAPTDVTIAGFSGKKLTLQLPPTSPDCDAAAGDTEGNLIVFSGPDANGLHVQGPENRWDVSILDVDGTRLVVVVSSFPDTPAEDLSSAQGILDALVINP